MAKVDKRSLFVFVPYLSWLTYAVSITNLRRIRSYNVMKAEFFFYVDTSQSYLNIGVWYLNGGDDKLERLNRDRTTKRQ